MGLTTREYWRISRIRARNAGLTRSRMFLHAIRWVWVWAFCIRIGLRGMRSPQLGSTVRWRGNRYRITNGVDPTYWSIQPVWRKHGGVIDWVPRSECVPEWGIMELLHRFGVMYHFEMGCWLDIFVLRPFMPARQRPLDGYIPSKTGEQL